MVMIRIMKNENINRRKRVREVDNEQLTVLERKGQK